MQPEELQHIGLSLKEASVYIASLTLGKGTAQEIAKKSNLKRPTTYFTIEALMKKGLMSSVYVGKKQYFMAESPDRLVDVFEAKQDEMRRRGEKLNKLIPELKRLSPKVDGSPVVKYYTGKDGALSMVRELLSDVEGENVWIIYPRDIVTSVMSKKELDSIKFDRHAKKVHVNALYTTKGDELKNSETVTRLCVSDELNEVTADIAVYGNKVRMTAFEDDVVGVVVENKSIASTIRTLFKLAWEKVDGEKINK